MAKWRDVKQNRIQPEKKVETIESFKNDLASLSSRLKAFLTDTFLITDTADLTLYVTRSNYTEKGLIDFARKNIDEEKIKNVGFVLNDVEHDYFGYGNKYGYGYHSGGEVKWYSNFFK